MGTHFLDVKALHAGIVAIFMQKVKERKRTRVCDRVDFDVQLCNVIVRHACYCVCAYNRFSVKNINVDVTRKQRS